MPPTAQARANSAGGDGLERIAQLFKAQREASTIVIPNVPKVTELKMWRTTLQRAVVAASGRTDNLVQDWLKTAADDHVPWEDLVHVPEALATLDNKLASVLLNACKGELRQDIQVAETKHVDDTGRALSSTQILRMIYNSLRQSTALSQNFANTAILQLRWLGDDNIRQYVRQVTELFNECGTNWPEDAKRDLVASHMKESQVMAHDLAHYYRNAPNGASPAGPDYTYTFLYNAMQNYVQRTIC